MTNDRPAAPDDGELERAVQARLRRLDPGEASPSLRARIVSIPLAPEPTRWRRIVGALGRAATPIAAAALVSVLVATVGLGLIRGPLADLEPGSTPAASPPPASDDPVFVIDAAGLFSAGAVAAANARLRAEFERSGLETTILTRPRVDPFNQEPITDADRAQWKDRDGDRSGDILVVVGDSTGISPVAGSNVVAEGGSLTPYGSPAPFANAELLLFPDPLTWDRPEIGGLGQTAEEALSSGNAAQRDIGLWRLATGIEILGPNVSMRRSSVDGQPGDALLTLLQIVVPIGGAALLVRRMRRSKGVLATMRFALIGLALVYLLAYPVGALDPSRSLRVVSVSSFQAGPPGTTAEGTTGTFGFVPGGIVTSTIELVNDGWLPIRIDGLDGDARSALLVNLSGLTNVGVDPLIGDPADVPFIPVDIPADGTVHKVMLLYRIASCESIGLPKTPGAPPGVASSYEAGTGEGPGPATLRASILGLSRRVTLSFGLISLDSWMIGVPESCPPVIANQEQGVYSGPR